MGSSEAVKNIYESLVGAANQKYVELKIEKYGAEEFAYTSPECMPQIQSDQVLASLWIMATLFESFGDADNLINILYK